MKDRHEQLNYLYDMLYYFSYYTNGACPLRLTVVQRHLHFYLQTDHRPQTHTHTAQCFTGTSGVPSGPPCTTSSRGSKREIYRSNMSISARRKALVRLGKSKQIW